MASLHVRLQSRNIFQHVLNHSYSDKTHCDTLIHVEGQVIPCHSAILATVSPMFCNILEDVFIESLQDYLHITLAGYTYQEVRGYVDSWYRQGEGLEVCVKVESVLNVEDKKITTKTEPTEENEVIGNDYFSFISDENEHTTYCDNYLVEIKDDKKSAQRKIKNDEDDLYSPNKKIKKTKPKNAPKMLSSGLCEFCNKEYKHLKDHMHDKHFEKVKEKYNKTSLYPQDCPFCGLSILNRKIKSRHPCFKKSNVSIDFRKIRHSENSAEIENNYEKGAKKLDQNNIGPEFICHLCGINCPSKSSLTNHVQMKCGNVCEICKEIFANKTEVKLHMFNAHQKIKKMRDLLDIDLTHECNQCDRKYSTIHNLNTHIKYAHSNEVVKVQCPDCGRLFSTTGALKKHSSLHKPPELPCPICGKLFHNNQYLLRHAMSVHGDSSEKKFKCNLCEKGFDTKSAMDGHKNWHLNLKPYKCRWCERTYQNQSNCNAHERKTHTDEYKSIIKNGNRRIQVDSLEKSSAKVDSIYRLY